LQFRCSRCRGADHDPAVIFSADHDLRVMIGAKTDGYIMIATQAGRSR
jgi:hypothetical protein